MRSDAPRALRRHLQSQGHIKRWSRSFFLFVVLPAWLMPGVVDWWFHRRTRIEEPENGGVPESLVHAAMFAQAGAPLVLSAAFEMNPLNIALMTAAAVTHELTAMADVRLASKSQRHLSQWEQHTHSFLEVMPFWVVPLMVLLHEPRTKGWSLVRRASALERRDLAIVAAAIALAGVAPYGEELLRCVRGQLRAEPKRPTRPSGPDDRPMTTPTPEMAALSSS